MLSPGPPGSPPRRGTRALSLLRLALGFAALTAATVRGQDYEVPEPIIQVFQPKGLRVSIPDSDGVELFAFHANVNQPLENVEAGELSADVNRKSPDGRWTYFNPSHRLRVGDELHYWLYVQRGGRGYQRLRQRYRVADLLPYTSNSAPSSAQIAFVDRPAAALTGQSAVSANDFEYRPPSASYESRPPPPPPYDPYRPPPHHPPPPPHDASRPSQPLYGSQPPPPPPYDSQPPSAGPPPGPPPGNQYGARPPPPPAYNHQYPPPPPPSQPAEPVIHNHHVGFASNNNYNSGDRRPTTTTSTGNTGDRYPASSSNGDRYPTSSSNGDRYPTSSSNGDRYPASSSNGDRYPASSSNGDRYPTSSSSGDRYPTSSSNGDRYPTSSSNGDRYPTSSSNGDRYPTSSSNGDRYPASTVNNNKYPQPAYQPDSSDVTFSAASPTVPSAEAAPLGPAWGEGGAQQGQGVNLPLTSGDAFAAGSRPQPAQPALACELSATYVNGRPACKGQVVFEEDFKTVDLDKWAHEVKISGSPDYEFCVYTRSPENTFVKHGLLHLKPTLTNDRYGADFIRKGKLELEDCTAGPINSDSCSREAMFSYILPPVVASRISTKNSFSFKYGKIDIRTRLPRGDWIYPEVWLQPLREEYGPGLASGRIHVAMARGNRNLRGPAPEAEDISGRQLVVGALAGARGGGSAAARRKFFTRRGDAGLWTEQFHNYTLLWTPETLAFSVDGVEIGVARPEEFGGLLHGRADEQDDPWAQGSRIAPFDKEFYISLGVAVGGIHAFPDGCRSGNHDKPWKNTAAKAMLSFWNAKDVWHPTWNGQQSELLVESVRVVALNN